MPHARNTTRGKKSTCRCCNALIDYVQPRVLYTFKDQVTRKRFCYKSRMFHVEWQCLRVNLSKEEERKLLTDIADPALAVIQDKLRMKASGRTAEEG